MEGPAEGATWLDLLQLNVSAKVPPDWGSPHRHAPLPQIVLVVAVALVDEAALGTRAIHRELPRRLVVHAPMTSHTTPSEPKVRSTALYGALRVALLLLPLVSFGAWRWAYHHWHRDLYSPEITAGMLLPALSQMALDPAVFYAGFIVGTTAAVASIVFRRRASIQRWSRCVALFASSVNLLLVGYGIVLPSLRWERRISEIEREAESFPSHSFAGAYPTGDGLTGTYLVLTPERFLYERWGCLGTYSRVFGKVTAVGDDLVLTPDPLVAASWRGETISLSILRWSDRTYLIESWSQFCLELSTKSEPRSTDLGGVFLRRGDWEKPVEGEPPMPSRLSRCYTGPPDSSRVREVREHPATDEHQAPYRLIVIEGGLEDGVVPFTRVAIAVDGRPTPLEAFVAQTQLKTSEVHIYGVDEAIRAGDLVTFLR